MELYLMIIWALVGFSIYRDAKKHGMARPELWGIAGFLFGLLSLPVYYFVRYRHDHPKSAAPGLA